MNHIVICTIFLIFMLPVLVIEDNNTTDSITYVSYIDDKIGFFKVIDTNDSKESLYKDRVLTMNKYGWITRKESDARSFNSEIKYKILTE